MVTYQREAKILDFIEREDSRIRTALYCIEDFWAAEHDKLQADGNSDGFLQAVSKQVATWTDLRKAFEALMDDEAE